MVYSGLPLTEADLQVDLDRRRPGTSSRYTTQRRELIKFVFYQVYSMVLQQEQALVY